MQPIWIARASLHTECNVKMQQTQFYMYLSKQHEIVHTYI
jgi:hypothetical protein